MRGMARHDPGGSSSPRLAIVSGLRGAVIAFAVSTGAAAGTRSAGWESLGKKERKKCEGCVKVRIFAVKKKR